MRAGDFAARPDLVGANRLAGVAPDEQGVLLVKAGDVAVEALRVHDDELGLTDEIGGVVGKVGGGSRLGETLRAGAVRGRREIFDAVEAGRVRRLGDEVALQIEKPGRDAFMITLLGMSRKSGVNSVHTPPE